MSGIIDCEERIDFNLAVSTGQEVAVTMDEYMDWALNRPETRVIGLFMETARNPAGLIAAFEKANERPCSTATACSGCRTWTSWPPR
jgi:acyl-CoA synthetase (NDP forming)